jgi:hypothetical protein
MLICFVPVLLLAGCLYRLARYCCSSSDNADRCSSGAVDPYLYAREACIEQYSRSVDVADFTGRFYTDDSAESSPLHLQLRFDVSGTTRRIHGHGSDRAGPFEVSEGLLSIDGESFEQRCCLLLEYSNGTHRVLYGQRDRQAPAIRFYGQWTAAEGSLQGKFHFSQTVDA